MSNNGAILPRNDLALLHRLHNEEQPKNRTQIANNPKSEIKPK
jgi:hypothetical protein